MARRRRRPRPVALREEGGTRGGEQSEQATEQSTPTPTSALIPRGPSWRTNRSRTSEELMRHVFFTGNQSESFTIPVHMKNVIGVELMRCNIPRGEYVVNETNHFFDIRASAPLQAPEGVFEIGLDIGDGYTAKTFITALRAAGARRLELL